MLLAIVRGTPSSYRRFSRRSSPIHTSCATCLPCCSWGALQVPGRAVTSTGPLSRLCSQAGRHTNGGGAIGVTLDAVVIFTGRGRSGTRLLSQLAAIDGIFLGNDVNKSGDSVEWVDLVYRRVVEAGGAHELPKGSRYRREIRARAEEVLGHAPPGRSRLWGLKLPEAMLVLPLLIDVLPQAKVVQLIRHPVSSSLRRTHMTSRLENPGAPGGVPARRPGARRVANRRTVPAQCLCVELPGDPRRPVRTRSPRRVTIPRDHVRGRVH